MSLGTVASIKGQSPSGYQPLLLVSLTFRGVGTPLLLSTHPLDGAYGPSFPGVSGGAPAGNYLGRIAQQDIEAIQHRSQLGIDRVPKVTLHLFDGDFFLYNNYAKVYGFRGATMQVWLVMWEAGTSNFSSDSPLLFMGTCDMEVPRNGMTVLEVSANTGHNTATVKLPMFPIQNRCPYVFPSNASERLAARYDPSSPFYPCGYSAGITGGVGNTTTPNLVVNGDTITDGSGNFIVCDFLRSDPTRTTLSTGCMARLGNYSTTTVAPDGDIMHDQAGNRTGRFGGIQWSPGTYYAWEKNYTSNTRIATFSFANSAIWGQYLTMLYGTQMVNCKIANVVESGNDTKCEALICSGDINPGLSNKFPHSNPSLVIVNGIQLGEDPTGDKNLYWTFATDAAGNCATGGRDGISARTKNGLITGYGNASYNALGDPYGGIARIICTFYKDIFTGFGTPTVQVRAHGPQLWVYAPIDNVSGNGTLLTITLANGMSNYYFAGSGTWQIYGNSLSVANGQYDNDWFDSPSTNQIRLSTGVTGSGTGGYIAFLFAGFSAVTTNPIWILADVLLRSNWDKSEVNWTSFSAAAKYCDQSITYTDSTGNTSASHSRYRCSFALETRRTAAEVIFGILRGCNSYLYYDQSGLLSVGVSQTLADSQPSPITGSNYNTGVSSINYAGSPATGYVAYSFDDSNIATVGSGEDIRLDVEWLDNATVNTPNQILIQFQDEDNQYVVDSLSEVDPNAVARAGGALQPGGAVVPDTPSILGIPNFDQAVRVANTIIAERQYGNENNDARGTRTCVIGTTVQAEHLHTGHLVFLSLQNIGLSNQLFRVIKIQPTTDSELVKITLQWENEIWRTDAYGQTPPAFYSQPANSKADRIPLPWQAYAQQPNVPTSDTYPKISNTEWTFRLAEIDDTDAAGNPLIYIRVGGKLPINQLQAKCQPPKVPTSAVVNTTGGSIEDGQVLLVTICAVDVDGNYSGPSAFVRAVVPTGGTNANTITLNNLYWDNQTAGYDVFVGTDHFDVTHQLSATPGVGLLPSSITLTSLPNILAYGPPDMNSAEVDVDVKRVIHAGIIGDEVEDVSGSTVTIGAPVGTFTNTLTGYRLVLLGRPDSSSIDMPETIFSILSYTLSGSFPVLTLDRAVGSDIQKGDIVVITAQANIHSSTTIGDVNFVSAYAPNGVSIDDVGNIVRIVDGKGRYQTRVIKDVTYSTTPGQLDTYVVDSPWSEEPDSTSWFVVEEPNFIQYDAGPVSSSSLTDKTVALVEMTNYAQSAVMIRPRMVDGTGALMSSESRSPYRFIWLIGAQGTRTITSNGSPTTTITQRVTDKNIRADATAGNIIYQCLSFSEVPNQIINVRKLDSSTNSVIVQAATGELFSNGSNQIVLSSQGDNTTVVFDGD